MKLHTITQLYDINNTNKMNTQQDPPTDPKDCFELIKISVEINVTMRNIKSY